MEVSPMWIPIVSLFIPIVAIVAGTFAEVNRRRLRSEERMALLARGVPPAEIDGLLKSGAQERWPRDPLAGLRNARRTAVVLISVGASLTLFFVILGLATGVRSVLASAAGGVIPLMIGIGFVVDYRLQKRELARYGLEVSREMVPEE